VTCGDYDLGTALRCESEKKGFPLPFWLKRWVNVKIPFEEAFGVDQGCNTNSSKAGVKRPHWTMKSMLQRLNIPLEGHHHRGIDDALNIAKIVEALLDHGAQLEITGQSTARKPGSSPLQVSDATTPLELQFLSS